MDRAKPTVLLVDDDTDLAGAVAELLEAEGFSVVTAQSGAQAMEEMRKNGKPCLLLCDYRLPGMNGQALAEQVRADPALADTPMVIVTGMPSGVPLVAPPGVQVLRKPFTRRDLIAIVDRYCRHQRTVDTGHGGGP